jgi:cyclophilin family peptidyl-prolyl cis-trans isomerase
LGRAQKLKQKRKEELKKKEEERRKQLRARALEAAGIVLAVALTVFLVLLINHLKENEGAKENQAPDPVEEARSKDESVSTVPDEIGAPNVRGAVGMAKPSDPATNEPVPDSATSEFYILKRDARHLDPGYTVFGNVVEGMDVVDELEAGDLLYSAELEEGEAGRNIALITSKGPIKIRLLEEEAPQTVAHLVDLVQSGFYNGLTWYRVEDWVVQTGSHLRSLTSS